MKYMKPRVVKVEMNCESYLKFLLSWGYAQYLKTQARKELDEHLFKMRTGFVRT